MLELCRHVEYKQGIDVLVEYMRIKGDKMASGLGHHKLMLATVDATWCCAVGCFTTEDLFLEKEGVFLLIDLLQVSKASDRWCLNQEATVGHLLMKICVVGSGITMH